MCEQYLAQRLAYSKHSMLAPVTIIIFSLSALVPLLLLSPPRMVSRTCPPPASFPETLPAQELSERSGDRTLIKFREPPGVEKSRQQGGSAFRAQGSLDTNQESFLKVPFRDCHLGPWSTWGTEFSLRPRSDGQGPTLAPARPPDHKHEVRVLWNTMEDL